MARPKKEKTTSSSVEDVLSVDNTYTEPAENNDVESTERPDVEPVYDSVDDMLDDMLDVPEQVSDPAPVNLPKAEAGDIFEEDENGELVVDDTVIPEKKEEVEFVYTLGTAADFGKEQVENPEYLIYALRVYKKGCMGSMRITPGSTISMRTGVCVRLPEGYLGVIITDIETFNTRNVHIDPRVISFDHTFTDEITLPVTTTAEKGASIDYGMKVAKLIVLKAENVPTRYLNAFSE
jgi:dUTPase